jgi:hypothetical protein
MGERKGRRCLLHITRTCSGDSRSISANLDVLGAAGIVDRILRPRRGISLTHLVSSFAV